MQPCRGRSFHSQAKPNMVKSTVVDNDTGKSIDSTVRTSTGTFFGREARNPLPHSGCGPLSYLQSH